MGPWLAACVAGSLVGEPIVVERDPERAMVLLQLAQDARRDGRIEQALEDLAEAIEADPENAAAYLTRAQIVVDAAGDLESPPADPRARSEWIDRLELAAADLERYAMLTDAEPEIAAAIERQRAELFAAVIAAKEEPEPEPEPEPAPAEPAPAPAVERDPMPAPGDRGPRMRVGAPVLATGIAASGVGVGLLASGLRIDRTCVELCSVRWNQRAGMLGAGAGAAVVGATLVTIGAVALARRGDDSMRGRRARRSSGAALLALGGFAAVGTAVLGGIAGAQWNTVVPSDTAGLQRTQSLANASLAIGSTIPALLGSGIALLATRRPKRNLARR